MKKIRQKHVILAFPATRVSRVDKMRGVLRFAAEAKTWSIDILQGELTSEAIASADGIIATGSLTPRSQRTLEDASTPTVFVELETSRKTNVVRILSDPGDFARSVVSHFLSRGLYNGYAVVTPPNAPNFHAEFARSVQAILRRKNLPCRTVDSVDELRLDNLPMAIFAANDDLAAHIIRRCRDKGLKIPRDAAVLGFSNDVVLCENNVPSISSVEPDFERQGYLAAHELDRLMSSTQTRRRRDVCVALKQIVERESTALPQAGAGLVRDALAFIRTNATRPIGVNDVVRWLNVSRRLVELRFHERHNCSILESILRHRLEATARELVRSADPIAKVCERCGWRSENGPKKLFRKAYGMSMRDYRKAGSLNQR